MDDAMPPTASLDSKTRVRFPALLKIAAVVKPFIPAPTTITS